MAKYGNPAIRDLALAEVQSSANLMVVTTAQPADYAAAQSAKLAEVAMVSGDFAISSGGGGRRLTVAAKNTVPVSTSGSGGHVCLLDTTGSRLLYVTTVPAPLSLTSGIPVNIASWTIDIQDPA